MPQAAKLEQIQFLLDHVSVQTTESYVGYKQRLRRLWTIESESSCHGSWSLRVA